MITQAGLSRLPDFPHPVLEPPDNSRACVKSRDGGGDIPLRLRGVSVKRLG